MESYATIVYVISDEVLRILNVKDDPQSKRKKASNQSALFCTCVQLLIFVYHSAQLELSEAHHLQQYGSGTLLKVLAEVKIAVRV